MKNEVVILSFVVAVVVMLNFSLILVIESNKSGPVSQKILRAVTGNNQLELFNVQAFGEKEVPKKTETRKTSSGGSSATSGIVSDVSSPKTVNTPSDKIQPIVDEIVFPAPYAYYDYDKDGKLDLVRQEIDGKYYAYLNKGTNDEKVYKEGTFVEESKIKSLNIEFVTPKKDTINYNKDSLAINWTHLTYPRFDVYIEQNYYNNNSANLTAFFDNFAERYNLLEQQTNWSVEKYYPGNKLRINVTGVPGICYGGSAVPGVANVTLGDPLYVPGCDQPTYHNGVPTFGNSGELGDWWPIMMGPIHESLHTINPLPIYMRSWLTEGFSIYNQYNILSLNGDINQETSDGYIYSGLSTYNWQNYTLNNYRDSANNEIQQSMGYHITAWMFSMMRNNKHLDWNKFYNLIDTNNETLNKVYTMRSQSVYYTDTFIIDVFGRASGLSFPSTKNIWKYDGPSGPGWGVRNWTDNNGVIDWYADLTPTLTPSKTSAGLNENITLNARVYNNGNVSLINVPVSIYASTSCYPLKTQTVSVSANSYTDVTVNYSSPKSSVVGFTVKVDENNIKIEKDETNNQASASVGIGCYTYFDKTKGKWVNTCSAAQASVIVCDGVA